MWNESSSVNLANFVNTSATIPQIWNFSKRVTFFGAPCAVVPHDFSFASQVLQLLLNEYKMLNRQYGHRLNNVNIIDTFKLTGL